jgi:hypothetical protein
MMDDLLAAVCAPGTRLLPFISISSSISADVMLPAALLTTVYMLLAALASLALIRCVACGHWLPLPAYPQSTKGSSSNAPYGEQESASSAATSSAVCHDGQHSAARQTTAIAAATWPMQLSLWLHTALYIVELCCTSMVCDYTPMAAHHVFSVLLFIVTLWEPVSLC